MEKRKEVSFIFTPHGHKFPMKDTQMSCTKQLIHAYVETEEELR